tara:strand:- start:1083 stop:1952 length:870 start_codon:yes stop_codon:yes gene_type:complete
MAEINVFLQNLQEQFRELCLLLKIVLKEEKSLHDSILFKKGFIIHSYSMNYSRINLDILSRILIQLEIIINKDVQLQNDLENHSVELNKIEKDYSLITKKRLHTDLLEEYLKEALSYCTLMNTRVKQLNSMLQDGTKLHKKSLPKQTEIFFASFNNIGTIILKFIKFLEQLAQKIVNFEKESYFSKPRMYGRAMARVEYKKTLTNKKLSSIKNPTPVFDAPKSVINRIKEMSKDQTKLFFGQIGVLGGVNVVFFETKLKPINQDPIPQSNGLREYKFPKGIEIEILEAA